MGELVFLAIGVVVGAAFYAVIRPTIRKLSGGTFFTEGEGKPPAPGA